MFVQLLFHLKFIYGIIFLGKCFNSKIFHIYVQTQKTPKNVKKKRETGCGHPVDDSAKQKQRPSR